MPIKKLICHPLTFLVIVCLGIGIYKIAVLRCVSRDSVTFMQFAQDLKTVPGAAVKSSDQHPGYPAIIIASEWMLRKLGYDQTLEQRIVAAQAATLICRIIAVCFLYYIFRFFENKKVALLTTILVILIPVYADNGSEVLSDWPNLMLMTIALLFCLRGLRNENYLNFISAGLASGLAYWIRPEGAVFIVIMGIYTLIHGFNTDRAKLWSCLGVMVVAAGLITTPYMLYKGALIPKKKIGTFGQHIPVESSNTDNEVITGHPFQSATLTATLPVKLAKAALNFIDELFNTIFLFSIPLLGVLLYKMKRFRRLSSQDQLLCLFSGLWVGLMIWLHSRHGYMSLRHIMPLVVFDFAWIIKGLHGAAFVFGSKRQNLHRNTAILMGVCVAIFVPKLIRPAHADKVAYREAGLWLRDNTPADATLAVFDNRIGFYAERSYQPLNRKMLPKQEYLVVRKTDEPVTLPKTALLIKTCQTDTDKIIRIYQVKP